MNSIVSEKFTNTFKLLVRVLLTLFCTFQICVVSYKFFYNFGSTDFFKNFYGCTGVVLDLIAIFLLNFERGFRAKLFAYILILFSLFIFATESFSEAPDIKIEDTSYTETLKANNELLQSTAKALTDSISKTEGGYGTSNSKMADKVQSLVNTSIEVAKTSNDYKKEISANKQMEVFKMIGTKFNIAPQSLFIFFLFIRGALLEMSLIVLSFKPKENNFSIFNYAKNFIISKLPKPYVKKGRPRKTSTEKAPYVRKIKKELPITSVVEKPEVKVVPKKRILKTKAPKLSEEKLKEFFDTDAEESRIIDEFTDIANSNKDEY